jgi:hypothetical protein
MIAGQAQALPRVADITSKWSGLTAARGVYHTHPVNPLGKARNQGAIRSNCQKGSFIECVLPGFVVLLSIVMQYAGSLVLQKTQKERSLVGQHRAKEES